MTNIIIETAAKVVGTLLITLIGVWGTWLTVKITKGQEIKNINAALNTVTFAAQQTVLELQQTVVEGWKEANEDGKLTSEEISSLGKMLIQKTLDKLSDPVVELIEAAGIDLTATIQSAGEAYIASLKREEYEIGECVDVGDYMTATATSIYPKESVTASIN